MNAPESKRKVENPWRQFCEVCGEKTVESIVGVSYTNDTGVRVEHVRLRCPKRVRWWHFLFGCCDRHGEEIDLSGCC